MATLLAAALFATILAATPCAAFTVTVNTEGYGDAYNDELSLEEALRAAYEGPGYRCMSQAETAQFDIAFFQT
ncbi:MAG TPA: hypothetical protein VGV61_17790, partial [Thermoanaerobaculia bacterium]|nr:hypothetical protein [Thermoanaerobaculia bacterium]